MITLIKITLARWMRRISSLSSSAKNSQNMHMPRGHELTPRIESTGASSRMGQVVLYEIRSKSFAILVIIRIATGTTEIFMWISMMKVIIIIVVVVVLVMMLMMLLMVIVGMIMGLLMLMAMILVMMILGMEMLVMMGPLSVIVSPTVARISILRGILTSSIKVIGGGQMMLKLMSGMMAMVLMVHGVLLIIKPAIIKIRGRGWASIERGSTLKSRRWHTKGLRWAGHGRSTLTQHFPFQLFQGMTVGGQDAMTHGSGLARLRR